MALDEQTLENVASNGEMDYAKWPSIIEPLIESINHTAYNEFPIPRPYTNIQRPPSPSQQKTDISDPTPTTQTPSTPARTLPPVPLFPNSSATSTSHVPDSLPASQDDSASHQIEELPQVLLQLLQGIIATLRASFMQQPPHTIQRLSELVLRPTHHYKTLPAWLRAVDRVVNVSSTADIFPLSDQASLTNGVNGDPGSGFLFGSTTDSLTGRNGYDNNSLGSDESLGGALLTPISWIRNSTQDTDETNDTQTTTTTTSLDTDDGLGDPLELPSSTSDNHAPTAAVTTSSDPFVPERPEGAVTQGELIRMEQEAGVVPVSANPTRPMPGQEDTAEMDEMGEAVPHARGPDLVGAIDMGKVEGQNVEVRIGSPENEREGQMHVTEGDKAVSPEEDFEMVDKDAGDAMDVDASEVSREKTLGDEAVKEDDDMVLVDAEDATAEAGKAKQQD